ncbi:hypothetical protein EGW08_014781 [Elysia chlorotica]|uniref:Denticleless protein homolog n=1 Tax=Elysia chlorotica TaxID=188477 RepID=A0A433T783_ELYCH|nr:hypothetical protein EGW08_014781 [Elysia chlorotica]
MKAERKWRSLLTIMLCKYLLTRESLGVPTSRFLASNHASVARVDLSFMLKDFKNFTSDESSTVDNDGMYVPPLACAFAKMQQHQHIVGVVDEDGFLVLYNTLKTGNGSVIKTWQAHTNAVFDLEWLQQEDKILTGSGDQTIALHDVLTSSKLDTFKGHASSIKSISSHTSNDDGSVPPANTIYNAHMLQPQQQMQGKLRKKRISSALRDAQQSVTSVLFQNENFIISAGAVDGCLKVWDIRKTYKVKPAGATPLHVFSYSGSNLRRHGYTSLVLDSRRMRLFASCTDDVIYEYNMASYDSNPVQSWRGHKNSTFYVKTALSPDDQFLLSGSSDERAYIWQLVTLSDDTKIKLWRVYCRELRDDLLPERCGQARKLSKERATSTDVKGDTTAESCPTLSATPKPILHKASSAPASAQSCMRTWLQTRVCSPLEAVQKQNQLKSSDKKSESNAETSKDLSTGTITLKSFRTHDKIEPQPNTTSEVSPGHSSKKEATPKEEAKGSSCLEATYSKLSKDKNEDIDSPTMNLPNLVIDNVNNKATPGRVKSEFSPGRDWLTLLRIEKQKKSIESKQASVTSPKVTKGMKKIQSYFKPKDTYK